MVGITLLVLWAAVIAAVFSIAVLEWKLTDPQRRVGGAGLFGAFFGSHAVVCGLALLVASFNQSVRAIRGLRWLVVVGLALAWFVPVAVCCGTFE